MHLKGRILQLFDERGAMWESDVAAEVMPEFGYSGDYWVGTVRLTLTDLFSSGLLEEIDTAVDGEKLVFRFGLTDFGRTRMAEAGLRGAKA